MDDFYNDPFVPAWVAFAITVFLMALAVASLRSVRGRAPLEIKMFVIGMDAIALLWVPFWFVYGVLTRKFS